MAKSRPMNLDLTTMVFPPMAVASILHRMSGVLLFLLSPWLLYLLDLSLHDESSFTELRLHLANPYYKTLLWISLSAAWYHLLAGVRHLLMDLGIGESVRIGRLSAVGVIGTGLVGAVLLGGWIW